VPRMERKLLHLAQWSMVRLPRRCRFRCFQGLSGVALPGETQSFQGFWTPTSDVDVCEPWLQLTSLQMLRCADVPVQNFPSQVRVPGLSLCVFIFSCRIQGANMLRVRSHYEKCADTGQMHVVGKE
jgi:hypothetical protein